MYAVCIKNTLRTGCNDSEYNAETLLETSRINHITKYESQTVLQNEQNGVYVVVVEVMFETH